MKIHNIRLRHAANSSSSHSMIFLEGEGDDELDGSSFGWQHFTAASEEAKRDYLANTLNYALHGILKDDKTHQAERITAELCGLDPSGDYAVDEYGSLVSSPVRGYIDHQSVMCLPLTWDEKGIDLEFFEDLKTFMLTPGVVILGGNDNGDEGHPLLSRGVDISPPLPLDHSATRLVARKDRNGQFWSLYNRDSGAKIRFSFDRNAPTPGKSELPELVDVKVTDYCPIGCEYCYQGSTVKGRHADSHTLRKIAEAFGRMRIFEVAIGGGEPTLHPDFVNILRAFKSYGVTPNFTTKSLAWLKDEATRKEILPLIGTFAYSVDSVKDLEALTGVIEAAGMGQNGTTPFFTWRNQPTIHYVLGAHDISGLADIVRYCDEHYYNLTLLGYKTTGRGADHPRHDYSNWIQIVKGAAEHPEISIDTVVAAEFEKELQANGVRDTFFTTKEGKHSMYFDAVARMAGPSSFCDPALMVPISHDRFDESVVEAFGGF